MNISSEKLFSVYDATCDFVKNELVLPPNQLQQTQESLKPIVDMFEDKKHSPDASIMIYGIYNSGKSTLINALLAQPEAAATGDIPLTDRISAYRWGNYTILDTPGVDAPIAHEEITRAQMIKADVIIFVVNPLGVAEERKTMQVLVDLLLERKKIFVVFNDKNSLDSLAILKIKDQTRVVIQKLAALHGIHDVLKNVDMVHINAKSALKARVEGKKVLLENSKYPEFEEKLKAFLQGISSDDVYLRLKTPLLNFLESQIDALKLYDSEDEESDDRLSAFLARIEREKATCISDVHSMIERESQDIYRRIKKILQSRYQLENSQKLLESIPGEAGSRLEVQFNARIATFGNMAEVVLQEFQMQLPQIKIDKANNIEFLTSWEGDSADASSFVEKENNVTSRFSLENMPQVLNAVSPLVTKDAVVTSLEVVKNTIPALMKGIGPKTMEKWAAATVGKYIPYVGTAITAILAVKDIFGGDSQQEELQNQIEAERQERERRLEQIEDFATETSDSFARFMRQHLIDGTKEYFDKINDQVHTMLQALEKTQQRKAMNLQRFQHLAQQAKDA